MREIITGHVTRDVMRTQNAISDSLYISGRLLVPSEGIWQSNSQQFLLYTSQVNKCFFVINIFYELLIQVTLKNVL